MTNDKREKRLGPIRGGVLSQICDMEERVAALTLRSAICRSPWPRKDVFKPRP